MAKLHSFLYRRHDILILMIVSLAVLTPYLFMHKIYNQDDFLFHKNRLLAFYQAVINHHDLHPMVFASMARGFGYAADLFYPSLFTLPFVLFYYLGFGFIGSYYGLLLVFVFLTALISYYSALDYFKHQNQALLFSVLYTTATYYLTDLFIRGALGESMAYSFMPLFLIGLYRLYQNKKLGIILIGLALGTVANIHFLSTYMMIGLIIALNIYLLIVKKNSWHFIYRQFLAYALSIMLSISVTLPVIEQMIHEKYQFMTDNYMARNGLTYSLGSLITSSISNSAGVWQYISPNIGPVLLATLVFAIFNYKKLNNQNRLLFLISSVLFVLSSNLLFWSFSKNTIFARIQFEWRLLTFVTIFSALLLASLVKQSKYQIIIIVVSILLSITFNFTTLNNFKIGKIHASTDSQFSKYGNEIIGGGEEFIPMQVNYDKPKKYFQMITNPDSNHKIKKVPKLVEAITKSHYIFPAKVTFVFPKYYYYGYELILNNKHVIHTYSYKGYVAANMPKGSGQYRLVYRKTFIQEISIVISSLSWLILAIYLIFTSIKNLQKNKRKAKRTL